MGNFGTPQSIVTNTNKDPERATQVEGDDSVRSEQESDSRRLNKVANEMAGKGFQRERTTERGEIVESDPHGTTL